MRAPSLISPHNAPPPREPGRVTNRAEVGGFDRGRRTPDLWLAVYCPDVFPVSPIALHKSALTMANIMESVKSCVGGATKATIDVTKSTTTSTAGAVKGGLVATADTTKAVANKAKELGQAGLNQTLKTLGAATAFQSIFGENIDKSDAGLTAAFNTVDVDSSGKISVKEMTAYIAMVYGGYAARTAPSAVHSPALRPSASIGCPASSMLTLVHTVGTQGAG